MHANICVLKTDSRVWLQFPFFFHLIFFSQPRACPAYLNPLLSSSPGLDIYSSFKAPLLLPHQ